MEILGTLATLQSVGYLPSVCRSVRMHEDFENGWKVFIAVCVLLPSCVAYFSTLKTEPIYSSETSDIFSKFTVFQLRTAHSL